MKIIHIDPIGPVKISKNRRARNILLKITPHDGLTVTIPWYGTWKSAEEVIQKKLAWIKEHLQKQQEKRQIFSENTAFRTREHHLQIRQSDIPETVIKTAKGIIEVNYPLSADIRDNKIQQAIREEIIRVLKKEARAFLPGRVGSLAAEHGFSFGRLSFRNQKTRWGSCSSGNNISLNVQLMRLPDEQIDYVILHELCHTRIRNHGREFWQLLQGVMPDARRIHREMKRMEGGVFL